MAPRTSRPTIEAGVSDEPIANQSSALEVATPLPANVDTERFETLRAYQPLISIADSATILPIAARLVAAAPAKRIGTDRKRLTWLCQLLAYDRDVRGGVNPGRALRQEHVDHYLRHGCAGQDSSSIRTYKSALYVFGRMFHPGDYPPKPVKVDRADVQAPYSDRDVRRLYRGRVGLSEHLAQRLTIVLDLATGVGARAEEMTTLTGASMHVITVNRTKIICLDLPSRRTGEIRTVPVVDPAKGGRLLTRAQEVGDGYLLTGSRHNAVNSVRDAIRKHGVNISFSAVRLRHTWIVDLAQRGIPTALLLQMADLGDSHTLHDLSKWARQYSPNDAAAWMREAMS
jgi:hypothetical protein